MENEKKEEEIHTIHYDTRKTLEWAKKGNKSAKNFSLSRKSLQSQHQKLLYL